jgi:hypothetical protein
VCMCSIFGTLEWPQKRQDQNFAAKDGFVVDDGVGRHAELTGMKQALFAKASFVIVKSCVNKHYLSLLIIIY